MKKEEFFYIGPFDIILEDDAPLGRLKNCSARNGVVKIMRGNIQKFPDGLMFYYEGESFFYEHRYISLIQNPNNSIIHSRLRYYLPGVFEREEATQAEN